VRDSARVAGVASTAHVTVVRPASARLAAALNWAYPLLPPALDPPAQLKAR
jgi:hypothetical protein